MAIVKHPILPPYRDTDMTAVTGSMWKIQDGIMSFNSADKRMSLRKRPGLSIHLDLGTGAPVDGLHWSPKLQAVIVVSGGRIFKISDMSGTVSELTGTTAVTGTKCSFAEVWDSIAGELRIFIANGGPIMWTNGTSVTVAVTGGIAPTRCTSVAQLDTYLIFNDLYTPAFWKHSGEGEPTNMTPGLARTMAAQRIPDDIITLFVRGNTLFICGNRSVEAFQNTGAAIPFASIGVNIETGVTSKDSVAHIDGRTFIFSTSRQLLELDGYTPIIKSGSYQREIDLLGAVTDIDMQAVKTLGGKQYILMNFNDQGRTLVYDAQLDCFYEWGFWDNATNSYKIFKGRSYCAATTWNQHIIGDNTTGLLYLLEVEQTTDFGNAINTYFEFGRQDHGSKQFKFSNSLFLDLKTGYGISSDIYTPAKAQLQWRDDGSLVYNSFLEIDLGSIGQYGLPYRITGMGRYRDRQFKLTVGDACHFSLNGIEEEASMSGRL